MAQSRTIGYVRKAVEDKFQGDVKVRSVKLRQTGMVSQAEVHIEMDGSRPLKDVEMILLRTELIIKSKIPTMYEVIVVPHAG